MQTQDHNIRTFSRALRQPVGSFFHALAILFNNESFIETGLRFTHRTPPVTVRATA